MTTTIKVTDSAGNSTTKTIDLVVNQQPTTGPVYGMNYAPTDAKNTTYEKRAKAARIYINGGQTSVKNEPEFVRAYANGIRDFVFSWKDTSTSNLPALFDSIPKDCKWYGITHHEPEDDIAGGGFTLAQWKSWQNAALPIVRAHGGIPAVCFMAWTLQSASGRKISDYALPVGLVDVVFYDYYPTSATAQAAVVSSMKSAAQAQFGTKRYGLGEYGVVVGDPTNGVKCINAIKPLMTDSEVNCYWSQQVSSSKPDYHFSDQTANAWFS